MRRSAPERKPSTSRVASSDISEADVGSPARPTAVERGTLCEFLGRHERCTSLNCAARAASEGLPGCTPAADPLVQSEEPIP